MAWYKIDDKLHSHPKARRAGLPAMGLWSLAGSHCMDYLTDGVVEAWFVESWPDGRRLAEKLVQVGLWDEHPDGWEFHDWAEYQPTREKVLTEREASKQRVERWRNERRNAVTDGVGNDVGATAPSPSPVPSPMTSKTSRGPSSNTPPNAPTDASSRAVLEGSSISPDRLISHIRSRTNLTVNATTAMRVALDILGRADGVKDNQKYVLGSITRNPAETQKFIYDNNLAE